MRRSKPLDAATSYSRLPASTGLMARSPPVRAPPPSVHAAASLQSMRHSPNMPPISRPESPGEVHRNQPVRRLRCTDVVDDGRCMGGHDRAAALRRPFWLAALCLAPLLVRVRRLYDHTFLDSPRHRGALSSPCPMSTQKRGVWSR